MLDLHTFHSLISMSDKKYKRLKYNAIFYYLRLHIVGLFLGLPLHSLLEMYYRRDQGVLIFFFFVIKYVLLMEYIQKRDVLLTYL